MEYFEVRGKVEAAVAAFLKKESFLLESDLNERSITHKLANYIESEFSDTKYDVDCEYNRMFLNGRHEVKRLNVQRQKTWSNDTTAKTVYPDIIVHNRDNDKDNLLVIEVKKKGNCTKDSRREDIEKIERYREQINYKYGLFLVPDDREQDEWFREGLK